MARYASVVGNHRFAQRGIERLRLLATDGPIPGRLGRESRLVQQLITIKDTLFVPARAFPGEQQAGPTTTRAGATRPGFQGGPDDAVDDLRAAVPPIFPGEELRPRRPQGVRGLRVNGRRRESQIADGDHARRSRAHVRHRRVTSLIAEGVELLHVAQVEPRLAGDELAQGEFECAVTHRIEWTEGQALPGRGASGARILGLHSENKPGAFA